MLPDFFAQTHTPYLHARGSRGTRLLLAELPTIPGQRILELGFGAGQTLIDAATRFPDAALYGLEKSAAMLKTARQRLRFCSAGPISLRLYDHTFPFEDQFFDAVYCESVLAIVPDERIPDIFSEIYRVLKPGGRFCCNESLWLNTVPPETIRSINRQCLDAFGIVQASGRYPYPDDWAALGRAAGFHVQKIQSLEHLPPFKAQFPSRKQLLSILFSRFGWLKGRLHPRLIKARKAWLENERRFTGYGRFLEGRLFVFQKEDSF